jgi:outer membrane lipoprotein-sorting protein
MMRRMTLGTASVVLALGLIAPQVSAAGEVKAKASQDGLTVEEILTKVDAVLTKVKDQTYQAELEVQRDGKVTKTLKFTAKLKGLFQKMIKFTAPGDVRDMAVLTTADGLMYVYMPSYKRVRRVAAHVRNQGFMGTDVTPEEMAITTMSVGWKAKILKQDARVWVLEMKPDRDAGNESVYSKLIVTVSKAHEGVEKIDSYDSAGKLMRSQIRTEWKNFGAVSIPSVMTFKDHRTGSQTVMRFLNCTVNQNVPDSAFTTRALTRGE